MTSTDTVTAAAFPPEAIAAFSAAYPDHHQKLRHDLLGHPLLTREAIRALGLPFRGWVANELAEKMPLLTANIDTLTSRFGVAPLAIVPSGADAASGWATEAANQLVSA